MNFVMTPAEATALGAWHRAEETRAANRGAYLEAQGHRDRAAEITRAFWPADAWDRAWSAVPHGLG